MAVRRVNCDKTEIILCFVEGNQYTTLNLNFSQISRIQFDKITENKLFRKVPSEKITIMTSKKSEPITYTRLKEKEFFDEYKSELAKFARNNRITFQDNTTVNQ